MSLEDPFQPKALYDSLIIQTEILTTHVTNRNCQIQSCSEAHLRASLIMIACSYILQVVMGMNQAMLYIFF